MKKILALIMALFVATTLVACITPDKKEEGELRIALFLGGYGQKWLKEIADRFEADNPGTTVKIDASRQISQEALGRMQTGSNDDIFIIHKDIALQASNEGLLEPLDELFQQEVETGVKLIDKIEPSLLRTTKFNGHYYKLPWTNGVGGFAYNAKMFKDNGWEVPKTYEELMSLCETIYNANVKSEDGKRILPFTWNSEEYYWDYVVNDWVGQLMGMDNLTELLKLEDKERFNPATYPYHYKAIEAWVDLVAKNPLWSADDASGRDFMGSQMDFIKGKAAMIPNAQWLESEMLATINEVNANGVKFEMKMMPTPFLKDARKDANGNYIRVSNSTGAGDSILIPAKATNKEKAKEFLLFLAKDENLRSFTKNTYGSFLGFNYKKVDFKDTELSEFGKSTLEIQVNSEKFNFYSDAPLGLLGKVNPQWYCRGGMPFNAFYNHYNNKDYRTNPTGWLADAKNQKSVLELFNQGYQDIKDNWDNYLEQIK